MVWQCGSACKRCVGWGEGGGKSRVSKCCTNATPFPSFLLSSHAPSRLPHYHPRILKQQWNTSVRNQFRLASARARSLSFSSRLAPAPFPVHSQPATGSEVKHAHQRTPTHPPLSLPSLGRPPRPMWVSLSRPSALAPSPPPLLCLPTTTEEPLAEKALGSGFFKLV